MTLIELAALWIGETGLEPLITHVINYTSAFLQ